MGFYIIEINDKYKQVVLLSAEGDLCCKDVAGLMPYTEPDLDTIRNEAYEKGVEDTKQHWTDAPRTCAYKLGYENGLNDAWEAVGKIYNMCSDVRHKIFKENLIRKILSIYSAFEVIEKIRQYEQEQEEQIAKGDVVRMKSAPEIEIFVTYADEEYVSGIALTEVDDSCEIGDQYTDIAIHKVEKTGRHYEIAEVLRKMREE